MRKWATIAWIACLSSFAIACGTTPTTQGVQEGVRSTSSTTGTPTTRGTVNPAVQQMSALEQMELAFNGNYTQAEIKPLLVRAMQLYGVSDTELNRTRAGSVLVSLRKEFGPWEMDILDHMVRSHAPGVNIQFHEAAALSMWALLDANR